MSQTLLISGPPGCGKTTRILDLIKNHQGPCGFLRLVGYPELGLHRPVTAALILPGCRINVLGFSI